MSKEIAKYVGSIETRVKVRKASHSRDILSELKGRVVNLEEPMGDTKDTLKMMGDASRS